MTEPRINHVVGRRVWDSRGRPTVEAEIFLDNGASGRAIAPAGASAGTHEAIELRDGGPEFGGFGVNRAIANINGEIAAALRGMPIAAQRARRRRAMPWDGKPPSSDRTLTTEADPRPRVTPSRASARLPLRG